MGQAASTQCVLPRWDTALLGLPSPALALLPKSHSFLCHGLLHILVHSRQSLRKVCGNKMLEMPHV